MRELQARYEDELRRAIATPTTGPPGETWQRLFTLNAAFFLGYWLEADRHAMLLQPLLDALPGLAGLPLPATPAKAVQAQQHALEIASLLHSWGWARHYPPPQVANRRGEHDAAVLQAARRLLDAPQDRPALNAVLAAHACRRIWQITNPTSSAAPILADSIVRQMRELAALAAGPAAIQLAEALLTEREELAAHREADLLLDALAAQLAVNWEPAPVGYSSSS